MKKLYSLLLAVCLMMTVASLAVSAENELPFQSPNNTALPAPWQFVAVDDPTMIQAVNSDGSLSDHVTAFSLEENGLTDGDFCYFVGQGHNMGGLSIKLNWVTGAKVTFTFTGTAVAVVSQFHDLIGGCSDLEFVLDGEPAGTLAAADYCSETFDGGAHIVQKIYFQKTDLALGEHTLEVINAGDKSVCLDGFAYIGDPNATEPPMTFAPVATDPVETDPPATTEPSDSAPADSAPAVSGDAQTNEAPKQDQGGCGSSMSVAPVLLIALIGSAVTLRKKH